MIYDIFEGLLPTCSVKKFKRNQIIYHEGDMPENLYFVENGLIGLFHIAESGKETFLRVFGDKSIFGHRSFFASENYHATTIALADTSIRVLSIEKCNGFLDSNPNKLRFLLKHIAIDLGVAEIRLASQQDKSTNQRIAESLIFLKYKYPDVVWTRKEIGEYSCSSHESVARFMTKYETLGLVKKIGRDFEILNKEKLLRLEE